MGEKVQKILQRIKRYLKNLMKALFGLDPYRKELEEAKEQLQKSAANMSDMQDRLYSAIENWDAAVKELKVSKNDVKGLQVLTENLRERIMEKDAMIQKLQKALDEKK